MDKLPIVIFDGDCALCNRSILFILYNDKSKSINVCPNNSSTAQTVIQQFNITKDLNSTIVFIDEKQAVSYKSTAILNVLRKMGSFYSLAVIFFIIPTFIRDFIYDIIAKYRKSIIRKKHSCSFITDENIKNRIINN